jgi:anti-sigma regulatory factor (Ser/Thr protein kinase)
MTSVAIRVDTADQAGEARRRAAAVAAALRLDEQTAGRLALVVTECANNVWKHGGGGEILLNSGTPDDGVDVLALDKGPGISDVARCFQDGYSTAGSSGTGLGAIQRLSTECQLYTAPGNGTALLARVRRTGAQKSNGGGRFEIGGVCVPQHGETLCGDGYAVEQTGGDCRVLVADGLGHGPLAAACADAAVGAFREGREASSPAELMHEVHGALRTTRGAAVAVGFIDMVRRQLRYAGVGNIGGFLWRDGQARHLLSHPGIAGHDIRTLRELTYELGPHVLVLLYSDGISTHWSLDGYEGLLSRDPSLIAGVLYRDHSRRRDDATVVVLRERSAS